MSRRHGTRSMYTGGCRCEDCTRANREAAAALKRQKMYGRWNGLVDAQPARDHVAALACYGIGWKRVVVLSGLPEQTVRNLLQGRRGAPPARRIRPRTEAAILAVRPCLENAAPSALVDATGTRRRLQALAAAGWPLARAGARLGWDRGQLSAVMRRSQVTASTALEVRALYDAMWDEEYRPATAYDRAARDKALAHARRMGWPPPMAWDDDRIDDPKARPRGVRRSEAA